MPFRTVRLTRLLAALFILTGAALASAAESGGEAASAEIVPQSGESSGGEGRKVALVLPLQSPSFGAAAEAVKDGFMAAAAKVEPPLNVAVYGTGDSPEEVLAAYAQAVKDGRSAVAGPLTRNAVTALAKSDAVSVPTLALNVPENPEDAGGARKLYFFGVQVEAEARQAARLAFAEKHRRAVTLTAKTPLAKRIQQAFVDEWLRQGGEVLADLTIASSKTVFTPLKNELTALHPDVVFLAADSGRARLVRPYLGNGVRIYATSQVFEGREGVQRYVDLNGVRFADMPWLLQPEHPAVVALTRPDPPLPPEMERLFALGVDACRLLERLLEGHESDVLDGVTGRLTLGADHVFLRDPLPAEFRQGEPVPLAAGRP